MESNKPINLFITGASGLVGTRLQELFPNHFKVAAPDLDVFDITSDDSINQNFDKYNPSHILHLAAYTDVNGAEKERGDRDGLCWKINVEGTKRLYNIAKARGCGYTHISTDYVFPGSKEHPGPYAEDTEVDAREEQLGWYGFTKAEAEKLVKEDSAIVRISYPFKKDRANENEKLDHVHKLVASYDAGTLYPMFTDQHFSTTFIDDLAYALIKIIEDEKKGIYHVSSPQTCTPFEFAEYVLERAKGVKGVVKQSSLLDFIHSTGSNPNRYPQFSGLKTEKTEQELGIEFHNWKAALDVVFS